MSKVSKILEKVKKASEAISDFDVELLIYEEGFYTRTTCNEVIECMGRKIKVEDIERDLFERKGKGGYYIIDVKTGMGLFYGKTREDLEDDITRNKEKGIKLFSNRKELVEIREKEFQELMEGVLNHVK